MEPVKLQVTRSVEILLKLYKQLAKALEYDELKMQDRFQQKIPLYEVKDRDDSLYSYCFKQMYRCNSCLRLWENQYLQSRQKSEITFKEVIEGAPDHIYFIDQIRHQRKDQHIKSLCEYEGTSILIEPIAVYYLRKNRILQLQYKEARRANMLENRKISEMQSKSSFSQIKYENESSDQTFGEMNSIMQMVNTNQNNKFLNFQNAQFKQQVYKLNFIDESPAYFPPKPKLNKNTFQNYKQEDQQENIIQSKHFIEKPTQKLSKILDKPIRIKVNVQITEEDIIKFKQEDDFANNQRLDIIRILNSSYFGRNIYQSDQLDLQTEIYLGQLPKFCVKAVVMEEEPESEYEDVVVEEEIPEEKYLFIKSMVESLCRTTQ